MPTKRKRIVRGRIETIDPLEVFRWADTDKFTTTFDGPGFPTTEAARLAWQACRRAIWAETNRMGVPDPARVFDELTVGGWQYLWSSWNTTAFSLDDARAAIEADRRAVTEFERVNPKGARSIADFLGLWRADLDALGAIAVELAH